MNIELRPLQESDLPILAATSGGPAWNGSSTLWLNYLDDQRQGSRTVRLAVCSHRILGYGTLLWHSAYHPFYQSGIPEISNLVVAESDRRQGIASQLIAEFEDLARLAGKSVIGLGVGLYADYGSAQRL